MAASTVASPVPRAGPPSPSTTTSQKPPPPPPSPTKSPHTYGLPLPHQPALPPAPNERYKQLLARLEKLGYVESLSPDSTDLVQRLLNDLIQTTESCRSLKQGVDSAKQQQRFWENKLEPLQHEVAQLTRENNQLHMSVIQAADARDERERKTQIALRKYQNDLADLQFLNRQLVGRADQEKRKAEAERFRLEHILSLVGASVGKEIDAKHIRSQAQKLTSRLSDHVQRIDIETGFEAMHNDLVKPASTLPDLHTVDLLQLAETRMKQLGEQSQLHSSKNADLQTEIAILREQVVAREQEIARLGSLLESERSHITGNIQSHTDSQRGDGHGRASRVEQLEGQIEFLHDNVSELEKTIVRLEKEKSISSAQSKHSIAAKDEELRSAREKVIKLTDKVKSLEKTVHELKSHPMREVKKSAPVATKVTEQSVQADLSAPDVSAATAQGGTTLKDAREKNEQMSRELRQLRQDFLAATRNLKVAKSHLDTILQAHPSIEVSLPPARNVSDDKDLVDRIVTDNNNLHSKVLQLEQSLFNAESDRKALERIRDDHMSLLPDLNRAKSLIATLEKQADHHQREIDRLLQRCTEIEASRTEIASQRRQLSEELDAAKRQIDHLKGLVASLEAAREGKHSDDVLPMRDRTDAALQTEISEPNVEPSTTASEVAAHTKATIEGKDREIEQLKQQLSSMQKEISDLCLARDKLQEELRQQQRLHSEQQKAPPATTGSDVKALILEFDRERDRFQHELDAKTERLADLESSLAVKDAERAMLTERVEALSGSLHAVRAELDSERYKGAQASDKVHRLSEELRRVETERKQAADQAQYLGNDVADVLKENQRLADDLAATKSRLSDAEQKFSAESERCAALEHHLAAKENEKEQIMTVYRRAVAENSDLSAEVQRLTAQHHAVQLQMDARENEISNLRRQLSGGQDEASQLRQELAEIAKARTEATVGAAKSAHDLSVVREQCATLEAEVATMRSAMSQLHSSKEELQTLSRQHLADLAQSRANLEQRQVELSRLQAVLAQQTEQIQHFEHIISEERARTARAEQSRDAANAEIAAATKRPSPIEFNAAQTPEAEEISAVKHNLERCLQENALLREKVLALEASMAQLSEALQQTDNDRAELQSTVHQLNQQQQKQHSSKVGTEDSTPDGSAKGRPRQQQQSPHNRSVLNGVDVSPLAASADFELQWVQQLERTGKDLEKYHRLEKRREDAKKSWTRANLEEASPSSVRESEQQQASPNTASPGTRSPHRERHHEQQYQQQHTANSIKISAETTTNYSLESAGEDSGDDDAHLAHNLVEKWKAQNEAMRKAFSANPLPPPAPPPPTRLDFNVADTATSTVQSRFNATTQSSSGNRPSTAAYRQTESERQRLMEENRWILDIVRDVSEDLKTDGDVR